VFNIGSGHGVSLNGLVIELERQLDRSLIVKRSPGRPFDIPVSILDISLARRLLGWSPRLSFVEGLSYTLRQLGVSQPDRAPIHRIAPGGKLPSAI
jgi:UDP-glucose 4-epimerase